MGYRRASPWPVFVAVGLAIFEVGIVLALFPLAVGGLLLLVGSVVGILREAEYLANPWRALTGASVVLVAFGGAIALATTGAVRTRGLAIVVGGAIALAAGVGGSVWEPRRV